eukprot:m.62090 g.62090  ORF g.62090 m.62090 type:complete len:534 (-) comp8016_c0_seq1:1067-2668(-)
MTSKSHLKSGYLTKQGGQIKSWKRRYFVVNLEPQGVTFFYFKDELKKQLLGSFDVSKTQCVNLEVSGTGRKVIKVFTEKRVFKLFGDTDAETDDWEWAIMHGLSHVDKEDSSIQDTQQVNKIGLLKKKGGLKKWAKRWVRIKGPVLSYFKSDKDLKNGKPAGTYVLDGCNVYSSFGDGNELNVFVISHPNRQILFAAETPLERRAWIDALALAGCRVTHNVHVGDEHFTSHSSMELGVEEPANAYLFSGSDTRQHRSKTAPPDSLPTHQVHVDTSQFQDFVALHRALCPPCLKPLLRSRIRSQTKSALFGPEVVDNDLLHPPFGQPRDRNTLLRLKELGDIVEEYIRDSSKREDENDHDADDDDGVRGEEANALWVDEENSQNARFEASERENEEWKQDDGVVDNNQLINNSSNDGIHSGDAVPMSRPSARRRRRFNQSTHESDSNDAKSAASATNINVPSRNEIHSIADDDDDDVEHKVDSNEDLVERTFSPNNPFNSSSVKLMQTTPSSTSLEIANDLGFGAKTHQKHSSA